MAFWSIPFPVRLMETVAKKKRLGHVPTAMKLCSCVHLSVHCIAAVDTSWQVSFSFDAAVTLKARISNISVIAR